LVITIIGNITRNKAKQISEILVANLPKNSRAEPIQDIDKPIEIIDKNIIFPAVETQILIGCPMAKMTDADWISMLVGNYILGNSNLGSTLYQELQQKYRIGYSTTSSIIPMAAAGPLKIRIYTEHAKNNAAKMLAVNILKEFVQIGPTNEAVEAAKKHIIDAFPLQFANDKEILQELSKLAFYGLPLDYFDNFVNKVNLVTRDDIILAFQTKINLDGLTMVSIGNAAKQS
jgi:zinc protease